MAAAKRKHPGLDKAAQDMLVRLVRGGNFIEVACDAAGIDAVALADVRRWAAAASLPPCLNADEWKRCRLFVKKLASAEANAETEATKKLVHASGESAQALMFYIERRYPERWGKRERVDHTHKFDVSKMSDDELVAFMREHGFDVPPLMPLTQGTAILPMPPEAPKALPEPEAPKDPT